MIHQDIKAAPAANLSCLFIGRDRDGHWWSRMRGAYAAAYSQTGPRRSGLRCMNASAGHSPSLCCLTALSSMDRSMSMIWAVPQSGERRKLGKSARREPAI